MSDDDIDFDESLFAEVDAIVEQINKDKVLETKCACCPP